MLGATLIVNAAQIGTGTISGSGYTTPINWNNTYSTGSASGTIAGIQVRAKVLPLLNFEVSSGAIDLGNLDATSYKSGNLNLEVGTNAANGVTVTVASVNGGLRNTTTPTIFINNLVADGAADSYVFQSLNGTTDSSAGGYNRTGYMSGEVNSTTPATIFTTTKPEQKTNVDDVVFKVSAKPNAETAAGDYADVLNFTVTGNF
jgi:hypothetical protein